jgi:hypothetical protein
MPDLLPLADPEGSLRDPAFGRDFHATGLAAEAAPPPPGLEQVAMELVHATFRAVDELIDRLVAQAGASVVELEPAGGLFWRPPARQHLDHVLPQLGIPDQLTPPLSALPGAIFGGDWVIAAVRRLVSASPMAPMTLRQESRDRRLFLRPAQSLAERQRRKHQCTVAPLSARRARSCDHHARASDRHRKPYEHHAPQVPRLPDASRSVRCHGSPMPRPLSHFA